MSDSTTDDSSLEEQVEELQDQLERLEDKTQGNDRFRIEAYDLAIEASSEETGLREIIEMCSAEFSEVMTRALVGEYQEIEREDMFSQFLG
ncbi:hypothetical protein [Haloarcula regularis]|nr:hypothetical protein [Halomicroarcula sp. SYNS111]